MEGGQWNQNGQLQMYICLKKTFLLFISLMETGFRENYMEMVKKWYAINNIIDQ